MSTQLKVIENQAVALMPTTQEWTIIKEQAAVLVKSGFLPDAIKTPEQAIAIALKGRELGIPMMQAFAHLAVIQGKPTMGAELMLAQILKHVPGAQINYLQYDDNACIIEAVRPGSKPLKVSFTIEDAQKAGLTGKDNWRKYPRAMLRSRCISEMARALFPDALQGVSHTPEELNPDIRVSEQGEIIDVPAMANRAAPESPKKAEATAPEPASLVQPQSGLSSEEIERLVNYVVPFGKKLKGMRVVDCLIDDLKGYADWLYNSANKDGKPLSQQAKDFTNMVGLYAKQLAFEANNSESGGAVISASQGETVERPF